MGIKRNLFLFFAVFIFLFSAANASASRERVQSVNVSGNHLYVVTNEWNVKIFELPSGKLVKAIELPGRVSYNGTFGTIKKVVEANGDLFIQAVASITNSYDSSYIYQVHGESVNQIGTLYPVTDLVGIDDQYLYVAPASKHTSMGAYYRYDKQMKERFDLHFDNAPDLVVADIAEDGDNYWYACLSSIRNVPESEISGDVVLQSKGKGAPDFKRYKLGQYQFVLGTVSIESDKSSVWIMGNDNRNVFDRKVVEFSVGSGTVKREARSESFARLIKGHYGEAGDNSLWLVGQNNIIRLSKDSLQALPLALPDGMQFTFNGYYRPLTSDDNNLWIAVNTPTEYVLRLSKRDGTHQLISIAESSREVAARAKDLLPRIFMVYRVVFVLALIVVIVLSFLKRTAIKDMPGRLFTGYFLAGLLLFMLVSRFIGALSLQMPVIALVIIGAGTVLLSRALNHIVRPRRRKITSWIFALFLGCSSFFFYFSSFTVIFGSLGGEGSFGLLIFAFYFGIAAALISSFVNMRAVFVNKN